MPQYRFGQVTVAQNSPIVTGVGTEWVSVQIKAGDLFSIQRENVWYEVLSVQSDTQLTLKTAYAGAAKTDASYAIQRDFTQTGLPTPSFGDIDTASLLGVALNKIDATMQNYFLSAVGQGSLSPIFTLRSGATGTPTDDAGIVIDRGDNPDASLLFKNNGGSPRWELNGADFGAIGSLTATSGSFDTLEVTGDLDFAGNLRIQGNLVVEGETVTLNTSQIEVEDAIITVGKGNTGLAQFVGLKAERGANDAFLVYDHGAETWRALVSNDNLTTSQVATITASFVGPLQGNATTATKLAAARTIAITGDGSGSVNFDGSTNVSIIFGLAETGVIAGSYPKVTVDAKGRVIAGSVITANDLSGAGATGRQLVNAADAAAAKSILAIQIADVANLQAQLAALVHPTGDGNLHVPATGTTNADKVLKAGASAGSISWGNVNWVEIGGRPTTIAGFGITNAYTKTEVDTALGTKQNALGFTPENVANRNVANGYAGLDAQGKVLASVIPPIAINDTFTVASQAEMLALTAETGDVAVRTDASKTFILRQSPASTLANWTEILTPTGGVTSVAGKIGAVSLAIGDISGLATELSSKLALAGGTMTGRLVLAASTNAGSSINIPTGTAPSSPTTGDIWSDGSDLIFRIGGVSRKLLHDGSATTANLTAASQAEAEAGTEANLRAFSPLRIGQAISSLGLVKSQNLNDVPNKGTARTNLDVFSKAETPANGAPTGSMIIMSGNAAPTGYVKANGASLSRTTYAALWAYAQASGNLAATEGAKTAGQYGPGDGSTTFTIPDLRGEFLRGWDDGKGVDSGRAIGSSQDSANKSHSHGINDPGHTHPVVRPLTIGAVGAQTGSTANYGQQGINGNTSSATTGITIQNDGDTEARPRNVAYLYCLKF